MPTKQPTPPTESTPKEPSNGPSGFYLLAYLLCFISLWAYLWWGSSLVRSVIRGTPYPIWVWALTIAPIPLLFGVVISDKRRRRAKVAAHLAKCRANKEPHL